MLILSGKYKYYTVGMKFEGGILSKTYNGAYINVNYDYCLRENSENVNISHGVLPH